MDFLKTHTYRILRKSEKYFKTDMVYLANGGFWVTTGQGVASLSALALAIVFANFLPKETYGTYKYILSVVGIFSVLSLTGLPSALVRAVAMGFEGTMKRAFWINMRWSIFLILGSLAGALYYFWKDNTTLALGILVAGAFTPFFKSGVLYSSYLQGKKDFRKNSIFGIVRNLIPVITLSVTVFFTQNPLILVFFYFVSNTLVVLWLYNLTFKNLSLNSVEDSETIRYAKHSSFVNILEGIASRIDSILLFQHLGGAQLAIYSFANAIPNNINEFIKNIASLAIPRFATRPSTDIRKMIFGKMLLLTLTLLPLALVFIFAAPYIFQFLFPQYMESVGYSQLLAITFLINGAIPLAFLESKTAIREKYILSIASNLVKIILTVFGVFLYGILGAIIAHILSKLFEFILVLFLTRKVE